MKLESFSALDAEVTKEDWDQTPQNVRRLLRWLLETFESRLADLEEDKILSKIENEQSPNRHTPMQDAPSAKQKEISCSFCGKKSGDEIRILSGPNNSICNECVEICHAILTDELGPEST